MFDETIATMGVQDADIAIVSVDLAGLLAASILANAGRKVLVAELSPPPDEADPVCLAAILPEAAVFARIRQHYGDDAAMTYAASLIQTLQQLPHLLPVPLQETESCLFAHLPEDVPDLLKQIHQLQQLSVPLDMSADACGCPFPVIQVASLPGQVLVQRTQLVQQLTERIIAKGGSVRWRTRVTSLGKGRLYTNHGRITAPLIAFAGGKPSGLVDLPLLWTLEARTLVQCHCSSDFPLHNCHFDVHAEDLCLVPSGTGATATWDAGPSGASGARQRMAQFRRVLSQRMPDWICSEVRCRQFVQPRDGLPFIGALPELPGRVLCASGFGRHSFLPALHGAQVLARFILGSCEPADQLLTQARILSPGARRSIRTELNRYRRRRLLHPRLPLCSHCRMPLRYDPNATWWACPLCGSCFGIVGEHLGGPALIDAQISPLQRPIF